MPDPTPDSVKAARPGPFSQTDAPYEVSLLKDVRIHDPAGAASCLSPFYLDQAPTQAEAFASAHAALGALLRETHPDRSSFSQPQELVDARRQSLLALSDADLVVAAALRDQATREDIAASAPASADLVASLVAAVRGLLQATSPSALPAIGPGVGALVEARASASFALDLVHVAPSGAVLARPGFVAETASQKSISPAFQALHRAFMEYERQFTEAYCAARDADPTLRHRDFEATYPRFTPPAAA